MIYTHRNEQLTVGCVASGVQHMAACVQVRKVRNSPLHGENNYKLRTEKSTVIIPRLNLFWARILLSVNLSLHNASWLE